MLSRINIKTVWPTPLFFVVKMAAKVAEVAQRCEDSKASRELLLNSCGLRKFPEAVFFILSGVEMQKLSLADNQFTRLPAKVMSSPVFASVTSEAWY